MNPSCTHLLNPLPSLDHLQEAIHKADLLVEEGRSRWPAHNPGTVDGKTPISIWGIGPPPSQGHIRREEVATMAND